MIPAEVEFRVVHYFFNRHLLDAAMVELENQLLPLCVWAADKDLNHDDLIRLAIGIIDKHLENKDFK